MSDIDDEIAKLDSDISAYLGTETGAFERVYESAADKERKQTSHVRSLIAIVIIGTYSGVILITFGYIFWRFPECVNIQADLCSAQQMGWDAQTETLLALLTGGVLPVVTLMLGFYFGTETAKKDDT